MPALPSQDVPLLMALCVRYHHGIKRKQAEEKRLKELQESVALEGEQLKAIRGAINAFGFATAADGWFGPVREAVGHEIFDQAMVEAGFFLNWDDQQTADIVEGASEASGNEDIAEASSLGPDASVRALTLEQLEAAGAKGALASQIRVRIQTLKGTTLHSKTVGMTLYRLSVDGLAVRKGLRWFCTPPKAETQNPGGGTPGLFNRETQEEDAS
jgi:hypothetical protein